MKYAITVNEVKDSTNGLKGFASVTLGESFKIINVAIMENAETKELFVSMPRYKTNEKDENQKDIYQDICNPITKEFREQLYGDILTAFVTRNEKGKAKGKEETEVEMPKYSVKVTPYTQEGSNVIGLARVYFEDCFVVNNITIIQGKENPFVSMPSYKTKEVDENNKPVYRDVCYPVTKEFREQLYGAILETYRLDMEKRQNEGRPMNRREQIQQEEKAQKEEKEEKEKKPKKSRC